MKRIEIALLVLLAISSHSATAAKVHYKPVSFADFMIDAPQLSAAKQHVEVSGVVIMKGQAEVMYESQQDLLIDTRTAAMRRPWIGLEVDNASRSLRTTLYYCSTIPQTAYAGCPVSVRGVATNCNSVNGFGAVITVPCIAVQDGSGYEAAQSSSTSTTIPMTTNDVPVPTAPDARPKSTASSDEAVPQQSISRISGTVEDCLNYLRSTQAEKQPGEFEAACAKEAH